MIDATYIHHSPEPLADVTTVQLESPERFEGPKHREAVLIGAKVVRELVETQELSLTDPLTELPNRRAFDEQFDFLMESRQNPHVAMLYIDVDNFKDVNDTLGHEAGDDLLKSVKTILAMTLNVREKDGEILARLGGDEFAALIRTKNEKNDLRNKDLNDEQIAYGAVMRMREQVAELAEKIGIPIGISIGIAQFREKDHENETPAEFKRRTDDLMYKEKESKKSEGLIG